MKNLDFTKYTNTYPYISHTDDRSAFDNWANANDRIQQEFVDDLLQYMIDYVKDTGCDMKVKYNTLLRIITTAINERDSFSDRFEFSMAQLGLVLGK